MKVWVVEIKDRELETRWVAEVCASREIAEDVAEATMDELNIGYRMVGEDDRYAYRIEEKNLVE